MTDTIRKIIAYYAHHEVRPETREKILKRLAATKDDSIATEAYQQLWDEIETEERIEKKRMFLRDRLWLKVAAVFLPALIFVGLAEFYVINNMKQAEAFTLQYKYTQEGERKTFVLPDGTKVDMKGGTVIQYPTTFDGKERRLYLVGEAFFDIHHDSAKPFHVITPYFDITDIGTSFTVSSYMTTDEVYVYVKTGCVELYPEKGRTTYRLSQDESLSYNVKNGSVNVGRGLPKLVPAWKTAQITIDNMTLEETMNKLSEVYGVKVSIRSRKNRRQCVTAHFNRGETLEEALRVIGNIFPDFQYKIDGDSVVIY